MCFSANASITSFILATTISIILFVIGTSTLKCLSIFSIYVAIMQLIEYILWKNIKCNKINQFVTKLIPIYLYLQPIVLITLIYYYDISYIQRKYILYIITCYIILFIGLIYNVFTSNKKICSYIHNKSLVWGYMYKINNRHKTPNIFPNIYQIIYNIGLLFLLLIKHNKIYPIIYCIISFITALYNRIKQYEWYSYWCYSVNMIPLVLLVVYLCKDYII